MPFLESYLVGTRRAARSRITDPTRQTKLDFQVHQEATHYKKYRGFNDTLADAGYERTASLNAGSLRTTRPSKTLVPRASTWLLPKDLNSWHWRSEKCLSKTENICLAADGLYAYPVCYCHSRCLPLSAKYPRSRIRSVVSALKMTDTTVYQRHRSLSSFFIS